jgi:hypothetical protein
VASQASWGIFAHLPNFALRRDNADATVDANSAGQAPGDKKEASSDNFVQQTVLMKKLCCRENTA